jgi:hypothetical protein
MLKQHYVIFHSPGTFVAEQTSKPVEAWDPAVAVDMAREIKERYGATPYGFCFVTRGREDNELDSREIARSNFYYLGGRVETLEEIKRRADPKESVLLTNMECNGYDRVIVNENSWRWTQPLQESDVILEFAA